MRKLTKAVLLALGLTLLIAIPVLAYNYRATYTVTENASTNYTMLAVKVPSKNSFMASNGFMNSNAMDTRVETLSGTAKPHMVTDNEVFTAIPVSANSQTNLYFTTGSSNLSNMNIITGYNGNLTIASPTNLGLGNSFNLSISGYHDITKTNTTLWDTPSSLTLLQTLSGTINATANATMQQTTQNNSVNVSSNLSVTSVPNGTGNYTNIPLLVGAATHWQAVLTNDGDTSYIATSNDTVSTSNDTYSLNISSSVIPANSSIISVTVHFIFASSTGGNVYATPILRLGSTETSGAEQIVNFDTDYHEFAESLSRPGGGSWTPSDLNNLQVGIGLRTGTVGVVSKCTQLYVVVTYTNILRIGQRTTVPVGFNLTDVDFYLKKIGSPVGTANVTVRYGSNDTLIATMGTLDVSTLTGSFAFKGFNTSSTIIPVSDIRVLFEFVGSTETNYVVIGTTGNNITAGNLTTYYSTGYVNNTTDSAVIRLFLNGSLTGTAPVNAERTIGVSLSNNTLSLRRDSTTLNSTFGSALSLLNSSANITLLTGNVMPYSPNITLSINGTQVLWYSPNDMIHGTVLPNRASTSNNATINFGANPVGINATIGNMVSTGQPAIGQVADTPNIDILSPVPMSNPNQQPQGSLQLNPFYGLVHIMTIGGTNHRLSDSQAWRFFGLMLVLATTIWIAILTKGNFMFTGIACGVAIGACVALTIWPVWSLIFAIVTVVAGFMAQIELGTNRG